MVLVVEKHSMGNTTEQNIWVLSGVGLLVIMLSSPSIGQVLQITTNSLMEFVLNIVHAIRKVENSKDGYDKI